MKTSVVGVIIFSNSALFFCYISHFIHNSYPFIQGIILSILIGSAAAGPLYGAFPVAAVFVKKGVKFSNILIFIGAWSTVKIPMFLFEMTALGAKFAVTRLLVDIPGIIIIAYILSNMISKQDVEKIYENVRNIS